MINNLKYLGLILLFIIIFSCKKKDDNAPQTSSTTTGSVSTNTPSSYYGALYSNKFDMVFSGSLTPMGGTSSADFSTNSFINTSGISDGFTGNSVNAGTVTLNGTVLQRTVNTGSYFFNDSTSTLFNSPFNWSVTGANGVPAINYTYTATRPTFSGYNSLPDTIKLSQNNVIPLNGMTGADEIVVYIFGGSGYVCKNLSGTATSVTITTAELSTVSATTGGFFLIICSKNGYQSFGGQYYKFKTGYELYKNVVIQ